MIPKVEVTDKVIVTFNKSVIVTKKKQCYIDQCPESGYTPDVRSYGILYGIL